MKKVLLVLFSAIAIAASAQDFAKGDNVLDINVGFGSHDRGTFSEHSNRTGWNATNGYFMFPVSISYERCIVDGLINGRASIGIGGNISYATRGERHSYAGVVEKHRAHCFDIAVKANFHYQFVDKLDTYVGAQMGGGVASWRYSEKHGSNKDVYTNSYGNFVFGFYAGARYYVTECFAPFVEVGGGFHSPFAKTGLAFRF